MDRSFFSPYLNMLNTWLEFSGYENMGCSDVSRSKKQNGKNRGIDFPATEEKVQKSRREVNFRFCEELQIILTCIIIYFN